MPRDLRTELKQSKPFGSVHEEAWLSIQRTAAVLEHSVEAWLKDYGITVTQYNVLRILRGAREGLACSEIGARMISRDPDITRLLDRLEKRGLIARSREAKDRRMVLTRITDPGLEILARLDKPMQDAHRWQLGHLGSERLQALAELLAACRSGRG
jgi:DNA-binding MarR family transcriptional regulator